MRKKCPICGSDPEFSIDDLGRYHDGYPGNFNYILRCPLCKLPKEQCADDIYYSMKEAMVKLDNWWNKEVDRIQKFLDDREK